MRRGVKFDRILIEIIFYCCKDSKLRVDITNKFGVRKFVVFMVFNYSTKIFQRFHLFGFVLAIELSDSHTPKVLAKEGFTFRKTTHSYLSLAERCFEHEQLIGLFRSSQYDSHMIETRLGGETDISGCFSV